MSFIGPVGKNPSRYFWTIQLSVPAVYKTAQTTVVDRYRNGGYAALTLELCPGLWTDGSHSFAINESDDNVRGNGRGVCAPGTPVLADDLTGCIASLR